MDIEARIQDLEAQLEVAKANVHRLSGALAFARGLQAEAAEQEKAEEAPAKKGKVKQG